MENSRNISNQITLFKSLLILLCWLTLHYHPAHSSTLDEAHFYRLSYMDDHIVIPTSENTLVAQRSNVKSPSGCAVACLEEERCSSFFYDKNGGICFMHSVIYLAADEATSQAGITYWQISKDNCQAKEDFILYRPLGLCYKYYTELKYWDDAESTCNAAGTTLVKVHNQAVSSHFYQFLRGSTSTRNQHVSIGASEKSGSLLWPDGSNVTWFNWASTEPSSASEKCVTMAWFFYFKWNDVPCSADPAALYRFICQKAL